MKQPPLRNPRPLRKHPGPIAEDALVRELEQKGFLQAKRGKHGAKEDSDVWVRRVFRDGEDTFEAIRIDRRRPPAPGPRPKDPGNLQAQNKPFVREHHTLSETSSSAPPELGGGLRTDLGQLPDQLHGGARKGDFSHWHHELFPATPDNLQRYLQGPLAGTRKLDPVGVQVPRRRGKGMLDPAEIGRLKARLRQRREH